MDSDFNYKQPTPQQRLRINRRTVMIVGLVGLTMIVGIVLFFANPTIDDNVADPAYKLHETSLKDNQNFSSIQGADLYSYNGLAFYKTTLQGKDNTATALLSGLKLPKPEEIVWGESKGAIMSFSESFGGTTVSDAIRARSQRVSVATKAYSWYVDFASGTLSLAATDPIEPSASVYSPKANGFYYVTRSDSNGKTALHFFDVVSKTNSTLLANTAFSIIDNLSLCDNYRLCMRLRDDKDPAHDKIYAISNDNRLTELFNSRGRISATNDPNRFVVIQDEDSDDATQSDDHKPSATTKDVPDDTDYPSTSAKLYDIRTKASVDLDFIVDQPDISLRVNGDDSFVAFDTSYEIKADDSSQPAYRAGSISTDGKAASKLFPLQSSLGSGFDSPLIKFSYGSSATLITDSDNKQHIFSNSSDLPSLKSRNISEVQPIIDACKANSVRNTSYDATSQTITVDVVDDSAFKGRIATFSKCIAQKGATPLIGYNYSFTGTDPTSGRLTTD